MKNQIENNFTYHPPLDVTIPLFAQIRDNAKIFANLVNDLCPDSREKALTITKIEEAVMWANAAISRNQDAIKGDE